MMDMYSSLVIVMDLSEHGVLDSVKHSQWL